MSDQTNEVHISSLIVQSFPEHFVDVCSRMPGIDATEIAFSDASTGKIVVLIEAASMQRTCELIDHIKTLPGVVNVSMVYHHAESRSLLEEPVA